MRVQVLTRHRQCCRRQQPNVVFDGGESHRQIMVKR